MTDNIQFVDTFVSPDASPFEIVERKGIGHPDTLADALAERLSCSYSAYTLERFGVVLRHQFDKTLLMCGRSRVEFGGGLLLEPIRVVLNGRASPRLGDVQIPLRELLEDVVRSFFRERLPMIDPVRDVRIIFEVRHGAHATTGGIHGDGSESSAPIHFRFNPRTLADLPETRLVEANDTSLGCAWGPFSALERTVLGIERELNDPARKSRRPWLGSDIKIMGSRSGARMSLVVAAPILSGETPNAVAYFDRIETLKTDIGRIVESTAPNHKLEELVVNSGDNLEGRKLYMNFTGSSIESGDEGAVGRGNRMGGVIAPLRPFTMEGIAGKNPRYHVGKVYCAAAWDIASRIGNELNAPANVFLVNRMGEPLHSPWRAIVESTETRGREDAISSIVQETMSDLNTVTDRLVAGRYPLF